MTTVNGALIVSVMAITEPKKAKNPKALLAEARKLPSKPPYVCSHEVGAITDVLLKKGFTHKECCAWFEQRGHHWNPASLINGWRHWKKTKTRKP